MDGQVSAPALAPTAGPAPSAAPGFWRLAGVNVFWLASQGLWNAIYVLIAVTAAYVDPARKELVVGWLTAAGGVLAVLAPIAAGLLSDRTRSRFGRRTPWIVGGTLINLAGLVLLATSGSVLGLLAAYVVFQLGNNVAEAAFAAVIPDLVPERDRGGASGLLNCAATLGTVGYLALTLVILGRLGSTRSGAVAAYAAIGVVLAAGLAISMPILRERSSRGAPPVPAASPAQVAREVLNPLRRPDFAWVLATRIFQTLGIWTILPFVTFYFQDVARSANAGAASSLWLLAVLAGGVVPAVACGYLSDRTGRRKVFVYASSGLQAAVTAVLLFTLVTDLRLVYLLGIVFGVGYGAYSSVDWALACDTLPERERGAAKDMALFHVAYTLPQVFGPALLAPALYALNRPETVLGGVHGGGNLGFRVVFASASVWFLLATVMVRRIRGVR